MTEDYIVDGQMSLSDLGIWSGKTCMEHSVPTEEKTSDVCWRKWQGSSKKPSLFLDLRMENGATLGSSFSTMEASHGGCSMHNTGECLRGEDASAWWQTSTDTLLQRLSSMNLNTSEAPNEPIISHILDVLEINPDSKYNLSPRACQGILNRAKKRGKKLPHMLQMALENVINRVGDLSTLQNQYVLGNPIAYKCDGQTGGNVTFAIVGDHENRPTDMTNIVCFTMQSFGNYTDSGIGSGLKQRDYKDATDLIVRFVDCRNCTEDSVNGSILSGSYKSLNCNNVVRYNNLVRRLTPLECERLQGLPDNWTNIGDWVDSNGKKRKLADSQRYKAIGNGIALPSWAFVLKRLCSHYERPCTLGSLFDGLGSFPLIWEQINGKGSCLWASEIEDFCIAVTKERFS